MASIQKLTFIIIMLSGIRISADWQASLNHAGFFGTWSLGAIYGWSERHSVELGIGSYRIEERRYWQSNFAYRFAIWKLRYEKFRWTPFQPGIFVVGSWDRRNYFTESSPRYPYSNYYEQTAVRFGPEISTNMGWKDVPIALAIYLRMIDGGLVALHNNSQKEFQYYLSSGVSLLYQF